MAAGSSKWRQTLVQRHNITSQTVSIKSTKAWDDVTSRQVTSCHVRKKRKTREVHSSKEVLGTAFWHTKTLKLADVLTRGETTDAARNVQTL
jgi:hypothetical protein